MLKEVELEIEKKCCGKVSFVDVNENKVFDNSNIKNSSVDINRRQALYSFQAKNDFERIFRDFMAKNMPTSYFEDIKYVYEYVLKVSGDKSYKRIYHAANCWESFLMFCSIMKARGAQICDIQHSAVYGNNYCFNFSEMYVYDKFLTWGWTSSFDNVFPVAIARFPKIEGVNISHNTRKKKILMVSNTPEVTDMGRGFTYQNYTDRQMEFIDNLSESLRKRLVIRTEDRMDLSDIRERCKKNILTSSSNLGAFLLIKVFWKVNL